MLRKRQSCTFHFLTFSNTFLDHFRHDFLGLKTALKGQVPAATVIFCGLVVTSLLSSDKQVQSVIAETFRELHPPWQGVKNVYFPLMQIGSNSSSEHESQLADCVEQESKKLSLKQLLQGSYLSCQIIFGNFLDKYRSCPIFSENLVQSRRTKVQPL